MSNKHAPLPESPFKPDCLAHKVVLVTGGATGIGFSIAEQFGLHGASVAIASRKRENIDEAVKRLTAKGIEAFGTTVDVRDPAACEKCVKDVVDRFGHLDFLINNAAGNFASTAENLTPNGFQTVLAIDLQGCFNMCKASLPALKQAGSSCIVNITSTLQYRAMPFQLHAASAKAGIDVLTNTLGLEWAEYGVRCVGIAPGPIYGTEGGPGGRVFGGMGGISNDESNVRSLVPAGRYGRVEDISLAAVYLCSSAAPWITSEILVVDGGQWHGGSMLYEVSKKFIQSKSAKERKAKL